MREEIYIAIVMFVVSAAGSIWKKNDKKWGVLFMFLASVAGSLVAGMGIRFREIVEGPFGMLDSALSVCCASVFVWLLYSNGTFDYMYGTISKIKNKTLKAFAVLLFIALPAALTGFVTSSILTTGKIVAEKLKTQNVENRKITTVVAGGAFIGMILPPNCVPAIIAANAAGSVLPTPYVGFFLPLLITAVPSYIVFALINSKTLSSCDVSEQTEKKICTESILGLVVVLLLVEGLLGSFVYIGGNVLIFTVASILVIIASKGFGSFRKSIDAVTDGLEMCVWTVAFMLVIGSFVEVSSMSGVRGLYSLWILPFKVPNVMLVMIAITLVFGFFLGEPLAAFLITYAVYPISWLANTVVVTGCAAALCIVPVICKRNGLIAETNGIIGTDSKYSDVFKALLPIALITLGIGLVWVYFGDNLSMLIL